MSSPCRIVVLWNLKRIYTGCLDGSSSPFPHSDLRPVDLQPMITFGDEYVICSPIFQRSKRIYTPRSKINDDPVCALNASESTASSGVAVLKKYLEVTAAPDYCAKIKTTIKKRSNRKSINFISTWERRIQKRLNKMLILTQIIQIIAN